MAVSSSNGFCNSNVIQKCLISIQMMALLVRLVFQVLVVYVYCLPWLGPGDEVILDLMKIFGVALHQLKEVLFFVGLFL